MVEWQVNGFHILNQARVLLLFDEPEHAVKLAGSPETDHENLELLNLEDGLENSFKNKKDGK